MSGSNASSSCLCGHRVPARAGQVSDVVCRQPPWGGRAEGQATSVDLFPAAIAMPIDSDIDEIDGDGDDDSDIRNTPWDDIDGWDLELVDDVDEDSDGDGNGSDMSQEW